MSENMKKRLPLTVTIAAVAATAVLGAGFVSAASANHSAAPAAAAKTSTINGYRNVGYFPQWGVYARDFKLKKLQDSGGASKLTNLNYAFGNINNQSLECFIANKAQGEGPNGSDGAGDAWADFGMGYTAANSVAGVADAWDQKLAGSFNQLKQLKAKNPQLKPMISIGGWTWSKNFSRAAATDASRKKTGFQLREPLPERQSSGDRRPRRRRRGGRRLRGHRHRLGMARIEQWQRRQ